MAPELTNVSKNCMGVGGRFSSLNCDTENSEDRATKVHDHVANDDQDRTTIIQFKHFDVVPVASDHHYLQSNKSGIAKKNIDGSKSRIYAKVMKEWRILEKNLPESIYVQVYETRIDLLRAVIIGPHGTSYQDGLFFFDIILPYDYPNQPPQVYYHSHGYRLNPNLYATGYVCLSLINTWGGTIAETWTNKSTILQILVSIQGLVLNEKPFFNEPWYADKKNSKPTFWTNYPKQSKKYNENVFILSCKTMLQVMRKGPEGFEVFVDQHFRARGAFILANVKDYYQEGYVPVSSKFKETLVKLYSDLEQAFRLINPKLKIERIGKRKFEEEEVSASKSKRSRNDKDLSDIKVKNQETTDDHKGGIFQRIISWIWNY